MLLSSSYNIEPEIYFYSSCKLISFPASNTISLTLVTTKPKSLTKILYIFYKGYKPKDFSNNSPTKKSIFIFLALNTQHTHNYTFNLHLHLHYTLHFYTYTNTKTLTLTLTLTLTHISHKSHTATQRGSTRYTHTHTTQYNVIYFFIVVIHTAE